MSSMVELVGPWQAKLVGDNAHGDVYEVWNDGGFPIAEYLRKEQADVIAAAPELLDCLERLLKRAELVPCKAGGKDAKPGEGMDGGKWRVESSIDGWIVDAREIVAKAKGGAA